MPSSLNCGSTWRPPGVYCLRHSLEKITNISEFSSPPFDIFSTKSSKNNNNNNCIICYHNNGGIICNEGVLVDSKAGAGGGAADVDVDAHINVALMNQIESNQYKYNNTTSSSSSADTTDTTPTTTTTTTTTINNNTSTYDDNNKANIAHRIYRTDKKIE
jgi:hypothetical protein